MKVIKIRKTYRNGEKEHFIVVDDSYGDDSIEDIVLEWGERDSSGSNYGYKLYWDEVEDVTIIKKACEDKLEEIRREIKQLHKEENKIMWFLGDRDKFGK